MTERRYRAYISYSHRDERWAARLHRALESYRVPRKLVGRKTAVGEVPARIRPVFRDRDELSSSADLSNTVKQALADSECLIVICSPAAAASRWVGEEIREFARLGRSQRIFCIIVDGEPAADGSVSACFPPALAEIGLQEPLAADARTWADGRRGAKLKLIAGLLGVKLDELRQRDLQRRRQRQALGAVAATAVTALVVIAVLAQISQRHEREKAEQLATFVVDLGQRLKSETDLETRSLISAEAYKHLQDIDQSKLSPQTGKKVAEVLRQMGQVSQGQGKPQQALEALQKSRDLLEHLYGKYPHDSSLLFELGNAEFYIGKLYRDQGLYEKAMAPMRKYYKLTHKLLATDPENPDWIMEVAYSNNNLAALQLDSGKRIEKKTLEYISQATRLAEKVATLRPHDATLADNISSILAWAASSQLRICDLNKAKQLRHRVFELGKFASRADPANNDFKKHFAFALTGVGSIQRLTGGYARAEKNFERAVAILKELSEMDPTNVGYHTLVLEREVKLAALLGETGQLERASSMMQRLEPELQAALDKSDQNSEKQGEYIDFLLAYADVESRLGDKAAARRHLQAAVQLQKNASNPDAKDLYALERLTRTRYQLWRLQDTDDAGDLPSLPAIAGDEAGYQSCSDADSLARVYVMERQPGKAAREVEYLRSKGYADPNFMRFCTQYGLCKQKQ
jgi:tetratricopeptide (TPR) repeat protein